MALWHRIGPTRLQFLSHHCRRWHSLLAAGSRSPAEDLRDARRWSRIVLSRLCASPPRSARSFDFIPFRSFAAPVQAKAKPKPDPDASDGPRLNEAITAPFVRLVTEEGHNVISRREALDRAMKLNLDLVEVQRTANPPVCKIMDFHREKYKQEVKEKERAKSKSALTLRSGENKEVRFKAKTELKDLKVKADSITRLMERGYRVKCTAVPAGKEDDDLGGLLSRLLTLIQDVSVVESGPHVDSKQAYVIVRHVKFATKKIGKKVSEIVDSVSKGVSKAPTAIRTTSGDEKTIQVEEEWEPVEYNSEIDGEAFSEKFDEPSAPNKVLGGHFNNNYEKLLTVEDGDTADSGIGQVRDNVVQHSHHKDRYINKPLHTKLPANSAFSKLPASEAGLSSTKTKLEMVKEQKEEPSIMETNRYSRTELKGRLQPTKLTESNRIPDTRELFSERKLRPDSTRSEYQGRDQFKPNQRPLSPNHPSSSSPSYGSFVVKETPGSGDQVKLERPASGNHGNPTSPSKSFGIFSSPKAGGSTEEKNLKDVTGDKLNKLGSSTQTFGIFSAPTPKTVPPREGGNLENNTVGKPDNSKSPTPKFGTFSAGRPTVSSDASDFIDAETGKSNTTSSPTPRYGTFSTRKTAASNNQR
ncbi:uncharacterized protein [Typha latifolia]|uniref:uncharacterized protein n=1 Tax=Typha latifolia TaxID=4733 RepID=UPI003C2F9130